MDTDARLKAILASCSWVRDPQLALQILPDLAVGLPPLVTLPGRGAGTRRGIPTTAVVAVARAIGPALQALAELASTSAPRQPSGPSELPADDPAVSALSELVAGCAFPGLRAGSVPALVVAWVTSRALGGLMDELPQDARQALSEGASALAGLSGTQRAAALSQVAWGLSARLAGAIAQAARGGAQVQAGGVNRVLLTQRLVLAFPRQSPPSLAQVSTWLDLPLDEATLTHLSVACRVLLQGARDRVGAGKAQGGDAALLALIPGADAVDKAVERALYHPVTGPLLVGALPGGVTVKQLKAAKVPDPVAQGLVDPVTAHALSAAWSELLGVLLRWDVLSALVDLVEPIAYRSGRWESSAGPLPDDPRWGMLVPRLDSGAPSPCVVAVSLAAAREAVGDGPWSEAALERLWADTARDAGVGLSAREGDHGLALLPDVLAAIEFSEDSLARLRGPRRIAMGPDQDEVDLRSDAVAGVGISVGPVGGGFDGERLSLSGPAVAQAIALAGVPRGEELRAVVPDPLQMRRVHLGSHGLVSEGVLLSGAAVAALRELLGRAGHRAHVRGDQVSAGGISEDFRFYPVQAWWEESDRVAVLLGLSDSREGVAEVLSLDREALSEWHAGDQHLRVEAPDAQPESGSQASLDDLFGEAPAEDEPEVPLDALFGGADEPDTSPLVPQDALFGGADEPEVPQDALFGGADEPEEAEDALFGGTDEPEVPQDALFGGADEPEVPQDALFGGMDEPEVPEDALFGGADDHDDLPTDALFGEDDFDYEAPEVEPAEDRSVAAPMLMEDDQSTVVDGPLVTIEDEAWDDAEPDDPFVVPPELQPDALAPASGDGAASVEAEVIRLLSSYVLVACADGYCFGLRDGGRLRDAHSYDTLDDESLAYQQFLRAKIQDGFVPRADRVADIPDGTEPQPVDADSIRQALMVVMG